MPVDGETKNANRDKHLPLSVRCLYIADLTHAHGLSVLSPMVDTKGHAILRCRMISQISLRFVAC